MDLKMRFLPRVPRAAGFTVVAALLSAGCATTQPPTAQLSTAQQAVRQAEQSDAASHAPAELRKAQRKLDEANRLVDRGEYEQAQRLAEQARVDAELAEIRARSIKAQDAARELRESIRALQEEIRRSRDGS